VAQIDHLIQAVAEKVIGHGAAFKNSQKTGSIGYLFESSDHPDSPQITSIHAGCRGFAGATKYEKSATKLFAYPTRVRTLKPTLDPNQSWLREPLPIPNMPSGAVNHFIIHRNICGE
jgi:hypothetical protein